MNGSSPFGGYCATYGESDDRLTLIGRFFPRHQAQIDGEIITQPYIASDLTLPKDQITYLITETPIPPWYNRQP
jgi:hypothetical protein